MFKKLFIAVLLFSLFLIPNPYTQNPSFAAESPIQSAEVKEFGTSYDVIYDVGEDGITTVTEKIVLKNLTSQFYASKFKLIIGATEISDIKASDGSGPMEVSSSVVNNSTVIDVKFNQQVAGKDKELPWTIQFKSKDFAEKVGKVWEVRSPKVTSSTNLENYNLTIATPEKFGEPTLISPTPKTQTTQNGKLFLTFTKDQLLSSGVSANFGLIQLFDFDLNYHLENKNLIPILTNIALPPDTSYQSVIYQRIEPKPINVTIDPDGNYLAWYKLSRNQKLDINVVGSAKLFASSKTRDLNLSEQLRKEYTQSEKYWEKDNPLITSKLAEILGPNPPGETSEKVKLIYKFVVNNLSYDSGRFNTDIQRLGAVTALNNPTNAVCMEFTDLFIALVRAAGIPARELNGFAYSSSSTLRPLSLSKDILHSWPEYFDERKGWIMVDPTWENTTGGVDYFSKLDLNHFVFAIKGLSSSNPVPAGSYSRNNPQAQDVKVELSENDFLGKSQLSVLIDMPNSIFAGFPGKVKVKVSNLGNSVFPSNEVKIIGSHLDFISGSNQKMGDIPSFGTATFEASFRTKSLFDFQEDKIQVLIGPQVFTKDIKIMPIFSFQAAPIFAIGILFLMVAIYILVLSTHIFRVKKTKKK